MDEMIEELNDQPWYTKALISVGILAGIYLLEYLNESKKEETNEEA